jgi:hypothetical protein
MKIYELPCLDNRKSFYGKARVFEHDNGEKFLMSYNTYIAKITTGGEIVRLWSGESQTSNRHFRSFLKFFDLPDVRFSSLPVQL